MVGSVLGGTYWVYMVGSVLGGTYRSVLGGYTRWCTTRCIRRGTLPVVNPCVKDGENSARG